MTPKTRRHRGSPAQICVRISEQLVVRAQNVIPVVEDDLARPAALADVWREALVLGIATLEKRQARVRAAYQARHPMVEEGDSPDP